MSTSIGIIDLGLSISKSMFNRQLAGVAKSAQAGVQTAFKPLGNMIGMALGGATAVSFTKSCLELGSNLSEVQNVVDTTFKSMAAEVNNFANTAMEQFGLSETVTKKYMGTLGAMSNSMGFTTAKSFEMSKAVTGLSADVASFYNMSSDEAFTKLKAIWTGETESLKEIGVLLTQTNLDQYALNNGFGKTTAKMTEQEKVMLRYQYTLSALSDASGDFAKTSDSWANQTRVLSLRFDSLKATLGQGFINLFTPIVQQLNVLLETLNLTSKSFVDFTKIVTGQEISTEGLNNISSAAITAKQDMTNTGNAVENTAEKIKRSLSGFDKINKIGENSSSATSSSVTSVDSVANGSSAPEETNNVSQSINILVAGFEKLKAAVGPTSTAIKDLWNNGLSLLGNFTIDSLSDFYTSFLVPVGKWVLSEGGLPRFFNITNNMLKNVEWETLQSSLGGLYDELASLAIIHYDGMLDFYDYFLAPLGTWTLSEGLPKLLDSFTSMSSAIKWEDLNKSLESFWKGLEPITEAVFDGAIDFFGEVVENATPAVASTVSTLGKALDAIGKALKFISPLAEPVINGFFVAMAAPANVLSQTLDGIATCLGGVIDLVTGLATLDGKKILDGLCGIFSGLLKVITSPFQEAKTIIKGIWTAIKGIFNNSPKWFKNKFISIKKNIASGIKGAASSVSDTYKTMKSAVKNAPKWFYNKFTSVKTKISEGISGAGSAVTNLWNNMKNTLNNAPTWFYNKFKSCVSKITTVFNPIKMWFSTLFNGVKEVIKAPLNLVIGFLNSVIKGVETAINFAIKGLNKLSIKVPKWIPEIGGSKWGFNIDTVSFKTVPALAQGGYVKANTPQLAIIGDNMHQGEIVSPENKLREMAREAAEMSGNGGNEEIIRLLTQILAAILALDLDLVLDGESVKNKIVSRINANTRRTGVCEVIH